MRSIFTRIITVNSIPYVFALLLFSAKSSYGQLIPISLEQRIENSTIVLEGRVISQTSIWDEAKTHIYTSNVVEVYKVFKGDLLANQVEIITRGGTVGNQMERISNTLELKIGELGVFTAIANKAKIITKVNLTKLKIYSGIQGFIKYDLAGSRANDIFNNYNDIDKEIYTKILEKTKSEIKVIQKGPFQLKKN